ncbi:hypothetical protein HBI39_064090 [Parastagonospora nodorum]|nr:hypothetical protein HBI12_020390 [Parastagonospora nodorum]KAH5446881.1 hypothetical protein HBI47_019320 [Parastagonospora nodorum]KAH6311832.1 hypothetical protein HBI39_064090 [Parastagonospora nodorum]
MRRGFDQATSQPGSRPLNTGPGEPSQQPSTRTRRVEYEASAVKQGTEGQRPPRTIASRRKFAQQPTLSLPQQSRQAQETSERRSPAYLQGKNPYGQVLESVEHPYREVRAPADAGPPSQAGASIEGRPRTTGAFHFKTRAAPAKPDGLANIPDPEVRPVPTRQPAKPISVQAVKYFFESKASQNRSSPIFPPSGPTATLTKKIQHQEEEPLPSRTHHVHAKPKAQVHHSSMIERTAPKRQDSPIPDSLLPTTDIGLDETESARKHPSTALLNTSSCDARALGFERRALDETQLDEVSNASFVAIKKARQSRQSQDSGDTVRRRTVRRLTSAAETEEGRAQGPQGRTQKSRRSESGDNLRGAVEEATRPFHHRTRRCQSQSAPLEPADDAPERLPKRASKTKAATSQKQKPNTYSDSLDGHVAPRGLSHDGSSSDPRVSRRSTVHSHIPTANIGVQSDYFDVEVPDHVDWRSAYGRRKTQDFGFPGARIKPRRAFKAYKPLEDPGDWIRRSCGHFSHMGNSEVRSDPVQRPCRQCLADHPLPDLHEARKRSLRKWAITDSSISSSSTSNVPSIRRVRSSKRRRHHSECLPAGKCDDTFAKDLGHIIDAIIDEHTNSLQGVINNIKQTQPSLSQLRRVSEDLVQRCQQGTKCTMPKHTSCRSQCTHQAVCQPVQPMYIPMYQPMYQPTCQPVCQPQACEWRSPCPSVPPKPAEKLNVGSPGQVKPNVNDSPPTLREAVQTVPDLVDLVNSAADNLGVDLDRRPTARDDEIFQEAPAQNTPPVAPPFHHSSPLQSVRGKSDDDEHSSDDPWLQQTRRHLSELSEARTQMMDELDTIAEDLGIQLQDRRPSEPMIDPIQRVLSKVSTGLSRKSTRLRNKSIGSVVEEIPKMIDQKIDERRLSRVLTRIATQAKEMTGDQEPSEFPPEEVQRWLEAAQNELPAAIDSITNVLDTLPALMDREPSPLEGPLEYEPIYYPQPRYVPFYDEPEYEPYYEEPPEYELIYESEPEVEYDSEPEPEYEEEYDTSTPPPQRRYTGPIVNLNDRIEELERRLRKESIRETSTPQSEDDLSISDDRDEPLPERIATRQVTIPPSRKTTMRSEEGEEKSEPQPEGQPIERMHTERKAPLLSRQPTTQPERTFSFVSPVSSEQEEVVEPTSVPGMKETEEQPSLANDSPPTTPSSSSEISLEEPQTQSPISRIPTRQITRRATVHDIEPEPEFQPHTITMTRSMTQPSRRQSIRSPSPIPEEIVEEPAISRVTTRQLTSTYTEPVAGHESSSSEHVSEPLQLEPSPEPILRKATTRRPTERLPSPEEIIRRVTTRRLTQPAIEPSAPPSSPSTGEEPVLADPEPELPIARRRSTQPGEFALPDSSSPSYPSSVSVAEGDEILEMVVEPITEEEDDYVLHAATRRPTAMYEPPLRRQTTVRSPPSVSRRTTNVSRQPTFPEQRVTFEVSTPIPSRRPTVMSDPDPIRPGDPPLSKVATGRPARRLTEPEMLPLPLSRQLTRQSTEPQAMPLPPSRQLTRQATDPLSVPLPPSRQMTRQPTESPAASLPPSRQTTRRRTEPAPPTRVPTRRVTVVESEQAGPEVREEVPRAVTHRATTRIEKAITVGPELADSVPSSASSSIHTELFSESEPEPEPVVETKSQRVSRASTQPVSRQPTRQPTSVLHQPTVRDQTPPPVLQSRRPTRRPLVDKPLVEEKTEILADSQEQSSLSSVHEPLIDFGRPEPETEPREGSVTKPDSAHTSLLDEPLAAYDVYNALPAIGPEAPSASPEPLEEEPSEILELETAQHVSERRPTILEEAIPETEPGRVDRAPTALLSRDPESLGPPLARSKTRFDPEIDDRVPRVLTIPRSQTARPRSVSVAPGVEIAPPQPVEKDSKSSAPAKRRHKKVPNYPPEEQHPAAPAYPPRETPKWTRPDTQSPPPKPKVEPEPKKRRFLGWGTKPKEQALPVQHHNPEPHRDRHFVPPFRHAAPGPRGPPGGTLQRPRVYVNPPRQEPYRPVYAREPLPPREYYPPRDYDYPVREAPIYARKDDYYPRLAPVVYQPAPVRREPYPPVPVRREYPVRAQPEYRPPPRDYPHAQPRARSEAPHRNVPRQQPLRSQAPPSARHQPPAQQAPRHQEKDHHWLQAHLPSRRPQNHEEPSRPRPQPRDETFSRPPRRHAPSESEEEEEPRRKTMGRPHPRQQPEQESEPSTEESSEDPSSELSSQGQDDSPSREYNDDSSTGTSLESSESPPPQTAKQPRTPAPDRRAASRGASESAPESSQVPPTRPSTALGGGQQRDRPPATKADTGRQQQPRSKPPGSPKRAASIFGRGKEPKPSSKQQRAQAPQGQDTQEQPGHNSSGRKGRWGLGWGRG